MGTLIVSTVLRVAVLWWVLDSLREMSAHDDYQVQRLQKNIEFWRKWNERIGRHILTLETEYAEMVS